MNEHRETILHAWRDLGRPGARLVQQHLRGRGERFSEAFIAHVLSQQTAQQVTGPSWRSPGKIVATGPLSRVQMDILDNSSKDPAINENFRYAYVMVDVYSRLVAVYPSRTKTPVESINALVAARAVFHGLPRMVDTDGGAEFKGGFEAYCRTHHILHVVRDLGHRNALGLVDATIQRLRRAVLKSQVEHDTSGWVHPLETAAVALNRRPMRHLYGEAPQSVRGDVRLQYLLDVNAGQDILGQTRMFARMEDRLRSAGKFRVALPRTKPSSNPSYSARIHDVRAIEGTQVQDERGNRYRIWLVTPVLGGRNLGYFPKGVRPGNQAADEATRGRVVAFAEALEGHLARPVSLRDAGTWLQTLPGWRENGIPVRELVELFPEKFELVRDMVERR